MTASGAWASRGMRASSPRGAALFARALAGLCCWVPSVAQAAAETEEAAGSEETRRLTLDLGFTLAHFQQQAKTEIGGARGQRLVENTEFGLLHFTTYRLAPYFHVGLFTQLDIGSSLAGEFAGFDENGAATVEPEVGGSHWEWWLGPLVRAQYRFAFLELGWGAVGLRGDDARDDILNENGETQGAFRVTPSVAWLVGLGAQVPLSQRFALGLRFAIPGPLLPHARRQKPV